MPPAGLGRPRKPKENTNLGKRERPASVGVKPDCVRAQQPPKPSVVGSSRVRDPTQAWSIGDKSSSPIKNQLDVLEQEKRTTIKESTGMKGCRVSVSNRKRQKDQTSGHREADPSGGSSNRATASAPTRTDPAMPEMKGCRVSVSNRKRTEGSEYLSVIGKDRRIRHQVIERLTRVVALVTELQPRPLLELTQRCLK